MKGLLIGGAATVTAAFFAKLALSNKPICRKYTVTAEKLNKKITAAHISDLHESMFGERQSELIGIIKKAAPDVILITGDMVEDDKQDCSLGQIMSESNAARQLLEALHDIAPTFMVFGNHESNIPATDKLSSEIEALGIRLLHRRNPSDADMLEEITVKGEKILICGCDDPYFDRREPHIKLKKSFSVRFMEDRDKSGFGKDLWRERVGREYGFIKNDKRLTVLLSHRPEEFELYKNLGFDSAFSGHAHGGQWRLPPFINGVYAPNQGIFPRHAGGIYRYDGFCHIVSRGLSKKRMVRIFNRPEICFVDFLPPQK